ncbi:MAG: hypothetical protein QXO15_10450 [Nitrososphaerota archaeon]
MELLSTGFNKFLYDNFNSTESLIFTRTGSAEEEKRLMDLTLKTGIMANSTLKARYNMNIFNICYGKAYFNLYVNSVKDVFAFFGFKVTPEDPTSTMTEEHAGVMIENGKLYFSTANGSNQQKSEIIGINPTRDMIYKIEYDKLYTFPLPQTIPYFDTFHIIPQDRIWTLRQQNSTFPPKDTSYYCVFFIKNLVGKDKFIKIKKFVYGERYVD